MKSGFITALALTALLPGTASSQEGTLHEGLSVESNVMRREVRYSVYLPHDYERTTRRYPVVYLLHGYGGDEATWLQAYEMNQLLDQGIASGVVPPMIVVMPDGGRSWFIDNADGTVMWETMFLTELVPQVEAAYRVRAGKRYRGIAGLSMGGFGALSLSMRHPELFSAAAALSPSTGEENGGLAARRQETYDGLFAPTFGRVGLEGEARLTEHFLNHAPIHFVRSADVDALKSVRYWIDCGDDDFLSVTNGDFHALLLERGIPHEYRVRDGGHTGEYWRSGLVPALAFVGESFRGR